MLKYNTILLLVFLLVVSTSLFAQKTNKDLSFNKSSKTFVPVPVIKNGPAMKTGIGAMLLYFFQLNKNDTISPPSMIALTGIYTTNKSYYVVLGSRIFWDENKNRASFAGGTLNLNNDFTYDNPNGAGDINLVYTQTTNFITFEYSRKVIGDFYIGALYLGTQTKYSKINDDAKAFFENNGIEDNFISSIGLNFSFDSRDYIYYPTKGLDFSIRPKLNASWLGSNNDYVDTDYKFSYYLPIAKNNVLAFNLAGGFATGDVPFDGYQNYGVRNSLRAYQTGKYKSKNMVAFQAEYRWNIYKRWGAVFFAGSGSIWGGENEADKTLERQWLPSAGLGGRFMISREKKINLRLDYAIGIDGNQGVYFGIMEAF